MLRTRGSSGERRSGPPSRESCSRAAPGTLRSSPAFPSGVHQPPLHQPGKLPLQGTHFILAQKTQGHLPGAFPRQGAHPEILHGHAGTARRVQPRQFPVQEHGLLVALQFSAHGGRHLGHVIAQILQTGKVAEQLFRRLFPDAAHAGHIVAGIADQGLHVGPLRRLQSGLLPEGLKRYQLLLARGRIPQHHIGGKALAQVLVHADDHHGPLVPAARGKGGDAVVRLAALRNDAAQPEGGNHALHRLDLRHQSLRGGGTVGLVGGQKLMAEVPAGAVKNEGEIFRLLLPEQPEQHPAHDVQRARGQAVGTGHVGVGEKAAVQKGRAVHKIQGLGLEPQTLFQGHEHSGCGWLNGVS